MQAKEPKANLSAIGVNQWFVYDDGRDRRSSRGEGRNATTTTTGIGDQMGKDYELSRE